GVIGDRPFGPDAVDSQDPPSQLTGVEQVGIEHGLDDEALLDDRIRRAQQENPPPARPPPRQVADDEDAAAVEEQQGNQSAQAAERRGAEDHLGEERREQEQGERRRVATHELRGPGFRPSRGWPPRWYSPRAEDYWSTLRTGCHGSLAVAHQCHPPALRPRQ